MRLNKVQESFKDHMFTTVDAVENPEEDFANLFDIGTIPLDKRLKIYRNHIVTTLSDIIVMNFPLVEILTGKDFLTTAAKLYLFDNPPTQACLDRYGKNFPEFLKSYKHANALPYLSDIAKLDWIMNESRCAKDDQTLTADDLTKLDPENFEQTIFYLKNSTRIIDTAYPLDQIYHFCKNKSDSDDMLHIENESTYLLISRLQWDPTLFKLDKSEYMFFSMIKDGKTLGEILEIILDMYPNFDFSSFLQNYITLETFSHFSSK